MCAPAKRVTPVLVSVPVTNQRARPFGTACDTGGHRRPCASSCSWVPCSAMPPSCSTKMTSALRTVASRCAMVIDVRPSSSVARPLKISSSDSGSSDADGSSSSRIGVSRMMRARDRDPLPLAARQRVAAFAEDGVVAVRQPRDELVGVGEPARAQNDLVARGARPAVGDVLRDRGAEQHRILQHEADLSPQRSQRVAPDVAAVDRIRPPSTS